MVAFGARFISNFAITSPGNLQARRPICLGQRAGSIIYTRTETAAGQCTRLSPFLQRHTNSSDSRCQSSGPWGGVGAREEWAKPSSLLWKQGPQSSGKKVQPDGERGLGAGVGM